VLYSVREQGRKRIRKEGKDGPKRGRDGAKERNERREEKTKTTSGLI
jgi:hypothetical protein